MPNISQAKPSHGTLSSYITGFVLSVCLTLAAYLVIVNHTLSGWMTIAAIVALAIIQLAVQLFFFLHLGSENRPRWNLLVFGFMLGVVLILVFGSLWIMNNLNYHMSPQDVNTYIMQDEGIHH